MIERFMEGGDGFVQFVVAAMVELGQAQSIHQFLLLPAAHLDLPPIAHCHDAAFAFGKMLNASQAPLGFTVHETVRPP